jgi:hypothetical protein
MENIMKKLALFMLLAFAVPLVAVISDAQYEQEEQNNKNEYVASLHGGPRSLESARELAEDMFRDPNFVLGRFVLSGNLPALQYLVEVKKVVPSREYLTMAVEWKHNEIVKYLLDHGVNTQQDIQAAKDKIGMVATMSGYTPGTFPETYKEIFEILEYYTPKARL